MPREKLRPQVEQNMRRRDTIGLRTIVKYDPMARRPTTPVMVGKHVVARRPLPDSVHTEYLILDGAEIVAKQISYPSEDDCATAVSRNRKAKAAASAAAKEVIAKTKKPRKAHSPAARETA